MLTVRAREEYMSLQDRLVQDLKSGPLLCMAVVSPRCIPELKSNAILGSAVQGTSGLVLKDSTLYGKLVLKRSSCEVPCSSAPAWHTVTGRCGDTPWSQVVHANDHRVTIECDHRVSTHSPAVHYRGLPV
jgi:hypothetical protein